MNGPQPDHEDSSCQRDQCSDPLDLFPRVICERDFEQRDELTPSIQFIRFDSWYDES